MLGDAFNIFQRVVRTLVRVPEPMTGAEWADQNFVLSGESSNTSGPWVTTKPQLAILNAMTNDAIQKVDFFKSARVGGTKMLLATAAYNICYRNRNTAFYQPTKTDAEDFTKTEVEPAIRDCDDWAAKLVSKSEKSTLNTLAYKAFEGCNLYIRGGHSPNAYRRLTLDTVLLDELDAFGSVGKEGDATTLSWGRIKNSVFKKQIQISTPLLKGFSAIEKNSLAADDIMTMKVECPECGEHDELHWGGKEYDYGFKWEGRDSSTVRHYCKQCGVGWQNSELVNSFETAYWSGVTLKTVDGMSWFTKVEEGPIVWKACPPPRHIAFKLWSAYSQFSPWSQIVDEWYDAVGDLDKMQTFTNTTLGRTWELNHEGTVSEQAITAMTPVTADELANIVAVTGGMDVQGDRLEVQYLGHTRGNGNVFVLGYDIINGDTQLFDVWREAAERVLDRRFMCGDIERPVLMTGIDTQGNATEMCHKFLVANKRLKRFFGINGSGTATFEVADIAGTYKGVKGSEYYSIGVNVLKAKVYSLIRNYEQEKGAFRIADNASLPETYAKQLTVEKMEIARQSGKDRIVFTNKHKRRNEALDTFVYALAAKAHLIQNMGRRFKRMFD